MEDMVTTLTTQLTAIGTSMTDVVGKVLPIALPIIGGIFVVTKGIGIFKKVTGKI